MCYIDTSCDGYHSGNCPYVMMKTYGPYDNPDVRCCLYDSEFWDSPSFDENVINTPME